MNRKHHTARKNIIHIIGLIVMVICFAIVHYYLEKGAI